MEPTRNAQPGSTARRVRFAAVVFLPVLVLIAAVGWASVATGIPIRNFTRDPVELMGGHPLAGIQSHVGILIWWAAAAVSLFAAALMHGARSAPGISGFLLGAGILSAVLALDDLLLLHDHILPLYLGIGEKPLFLVYGLATVWLVRAFRPALRAFDPTLLLLAGLFFGLSLGVDAFQERWASPWRIFIEDGAKLLGVASWSGYLALVARGAVKEIVTG